ncbi:MAG TPA: DUF3575 domain-containing protein [Ginsengibacter sp.]|nr:DUF3575 domain-containing protein [Chitinophagaceae bacterium]MCZ2396039.1 DUF3575 domain-containing protein [Chitinophagales bacterium]HRN72423.1 DUF3575 domain-containing protein [Ginsengibacter sp.]
MFRGKSILLALVFAIASIGVYAQASDDGHTSQTGKVQKSKSKHAMNFVKVNIPGFVVNNYNLQLERAITRRLSLGISGRYMPTGSIPFKSNILKLMGDNTDQETKDQIESLRLGNYAITPEVRLYLGKGYGQGFYLGFFYRYANFEVDNVSVEFDADGGGTEKLDLAGKLTSNTGGIQLGVQKSLGKVLVLDLWVLGAHYGTGTSLLTGTTTRTLSATEQSHLQQTLDDIDIPFLDKEVNVNANGGSMKLDGPWGGLRMGVSLGVRF